MLCWHRITAFGILPCSKGVPFGRKRLMLTLLNESEPMELDNENIASLGYELQRTEDVDEIRPLLRACELEVFEGPFPEAEEAAYFVAKTPAGGVAASIGWGRYGRNEAVLHSLAVAPSSRGIGIGASLVASAMLHLRDDCEVESVFIGVVDALSEYFGRFGFVGLNGESLPEPIAAHPSFGSENIRPMVRRYGEERHGLDQTAFCLIHNSTKDATLPVGSVFWFRQSGPVLEGQYRGGPVRRGQLLGAMDGENLKFLWQSCTNDGELMRGDGKILVDLLDDGRREMREKLGEDPGELLLREL